MDPIIDLAPGAEDNPVAIELCEHLRQNLVDRPHKQADFRALRGSILMVAQDLGEALTLRFDHGRLTIHDGNVGIPAVTILADLSALRRLADMPISAIGHLPVFSPLTRAGRATGAALLRLFVQGDLKVYGLVAHPRTVVFLLRIFSIHG